VEGDKGAGVVACGAKEAGTPGDADGGTAETPKKPGGAVGLLIGTEDGT